jgi:hypothetical protein
MHAMISTDDLNIDVMQLEQHINKGKGKAILDYERYCPLRNWSNILVDSGQVIGSNCTDSLQNGGKF